MTFKFQVAPSPTSVNSNFSLSDSVSDIANLDMSDDYTNSPPDEEAFTSRPVLEKEGSLNSSMITVIVSLQRHLLYTVLQTFFSIG